ncbi:MAG TPA: glycoside hydrolase family 97 catalytic domain-containing protein, partial [Cyclobacteriaceae bacterium]|nr:glycoside hydrolase family 97 catalytic domain-containing protein [Cyclobacteriaceae bacterium]
GWNYGWDGNWANGGTKFNFTKPYPDYDIDYLSKYGKEKGVYIIGHHETGADVENYESQLEEAYQFLEDHGMKAVKTGYVGDSLANGEWHHGQYSVRHHQRVAEMAAKHHVMLVAHEPIKDTGLRRTYPNFMSREAARGQEYNAWGEDGGNPPDYVTIIPFTRMLSGPMDYTPGVFDLKLPTQPNNQINGTLAKELALYIILYAPLQMACDLPKNYEGHPAFKFIEDVATDWETTNVLEAEIGKYVTIARKQRNSENWFIGAITNDNPRETKLKLDFLSPGKKYNATIYKDTPETDYLKRPAAYRIEKIQVTSESVLDLHLAASGGAAISIMAQ